jgi:subtilisin family serine protease
MRRKIAGLLGLMIILSMLITTVGFAQADAGVPAKSDKKSYIVIMEQDPVIAYEGELRGLPATKPGKGEKINPNSAHVRKYEKFLEKEHDKVAQAVGVSERDVNYDYTISLNGFQAFMTEAEVAAMRLQKGVVLVLEDQMRYPDTDNSPDFLGLTDPAGPWAKGITGEDVVVGIIDSGIWPEHPSFADDGSYDVLPGYAGLTCDFGNTAHNPADAPFECNNKLLGAYQMLDTYRFYIGADSDEFDSARDDDGHGSHTAATSAGNAGVEASIYGIPRGVISGVAPRARIIAYKGLGNLGGFTSDLAAAIDQAVADGVDVINYSIGGGAGGPGADEIAFLFAADAGVFVATSAGNSGPGASTLGNPGTMPWLTTVGASTQDRTFQGSVSSSDGWEFFGASITGGTDELPLVDAADYGNELCGPDVGFTGDVSGKIVLCKRGDYDRVAKSLAVFDAGGAGTVLYNANDSQTQNTDNHWTPTVHINYTDGVTIKNYIAGTAEPVAQINGGEFTEIPAPWMAAFSSRGANPVAGDIIKPDITAPGVNILAAASPFPDPGFLPGELFQSIGGTSMSSPHVAGAFALLKQAHPDWSAAMAKSAIMTSAFQDVMKEDGMTPADPFDMGAGHLDVGGKAIKGSAFEPGLAYDAGLFEYAAFTCGMNWGVFTPGSCVFLESIGVPMEPYNLNYPSIGIEQLAGSRTVMRTVTSVAEENGWREYTVSVDPPPGYEVSVSPSEIRLKKGDSATYYVTITNDGTAPLYEWRFGSLTWSDNNGHYDVYSPIAVRGALFSAPSEVSGSGESGSLSFDVGFGYSGAYSAAPYGLEAATVTSDTVVQDPDQNFDPGDGYSNLHQFNLSGSAMFRIAMPPEAVTNPNIDLDIFVYGPGGQYYESTAGGTNELIDIPNPTDGVWDVYVHGWQTVDPNADYDLYTWAISASPGGSLTIDSAPASASPGVATITVSWTGATSGGWHLGWVLHTGDGGITQVTLVEVDNR